MGIFDLTNKKGRTLYKDSHFKKDLTLHEDLTGSLQPVRSGHLFGDHDKNWSINENTNWYKNQS